jgi:hypothetical protein
MIASELHSTNSVNRFEDISLRVKCHEGGGDWVGAVSQLSVAVNMATASSSYVSPVCLCRYYGRMDVPLTFSAFIIAISLLLQRGNPRFAQLTSSVFGLFYCGYLPSFWVKLRCGLAAPALNTSMLIKFSLYFSA